jgi:hypothetical protein
VIVSTARRKMAFSVFIAVSASKLAEFGRQPSARSNSLDFLSRA